jgi:hypothetical protein
MAYVDNRGIGFTATGLTVGTTPQFYVTATNASGESAASNYVGITVPAATGSPTVTLSGDGKTARIIWANVSNAIDYYVTRILDGSSTVEPYQLPEVTAQAGATSQVIDTGANLTPVGLDPTASYSWTVTPVFPASLAISTGVGGGGSGSGGSGGGSSGGSGSGSTTDDSDNSSTGNGTGQDSDPTDDSTGDIEGFTATVNADDTVTLNWSYQGSATFELEQEDTSDPGTNFAFVQAPGGRTATVINLNLGDNYKFRLRADRSDGTASDYAGVVSHPDCALSRTSLARCTFARIFSTLAVHANAFGA